MSERLMLLLLAAYAVILAASCWDAWTGQCSWGRPVYWVGAMVLMTGVLMQK